MRKRNYYLGFLLILLGGMILMIQSILIFFTINLGYFNGIIFFGCFFLGLLLSGTGIIGIVNNPIKEGALDG